MAVNDGKYEAAFVAMIDGFMGEKKERIVVTKGAVVLERDAQNLNNGVQPFKLCLAKTKTRELIPEDEPVFILRARDLHSLDTIVHYRFTCEENGCSPEHVAMVDAAISRFSAWRQSHKLKQPGITLAADSLQANQKIEHFAELERGQYLLVKTDGTEVMGLLKREDLPHFSSLIDAEICDVVKLPLGKVMIVDDVSHDKQKPVNPKATALYHAQCVKTDWLIRGDVLIAYDADFA
jgi:hypothetical protein